MRRVAADLLGNVLNDGMSLGLALEKSLASGEMGRLEERDCGLARLIVDTTLRRLRQINAVLDTFLKVPIDARAGTVPAILTTATAQILFLDIASHAVVNITTLLAG